MPGAGAVGLGARSAGSALGVEGPLWGWAGGKAWNPGGWGEGLGKKGNHGDGGWGGGQREAGARRPGPGLRAVEEEER